MYISPAARYMILSAFFFAFMDIILKDLDRFSSWQLMMFRAIGSVVICLIILNKLKINIFGNQRKLLITRGLVGSTSMILFLASIAYLPIGTAISIRYLSPIFAAILAVWLLKEKIKQVQWLYIFIAFCGVLILKGFDDRINAIGLTLIITSAVFSGMVYVIIRRLGTRDHPVVIVNYFMVIATITGGIGSLFTWKQPMGYEWIALLSLGIFGFLGQLFMTKGLQMEEANKMAPLKYMEVVFVLILAFFFLGETQNIFSLSGILLIVFGLLMNLKTKKL
jgi:drug/metabolite transporter (DMT)-like permease